jgi:hypothetical protein
MEHIETLPSERDAKIKATVTKTISKWNIFLQRYEVSCEAIVGVSNVIGDITYHNHACQVFIGPTCQEDAINWVKREYKLQPKVMMF